MASDRDSKLVALSARVKSSPVLSALRDDIMSEATFHADESVQLDPVTIIKIILVVVQVIAYCRDKRTDEEIAQDIRDIRTLPPRKLIVFRRKLNKLWHETCDNDLTLATANPFIAAVYEIGDRIEDETIQELLKLAAEHV